MNHECDENCNVIFCSGCGDQITSETYFIECDSCGIDDYWIKTKEMMPEENGTYLIIVQKRVLIGTFYNGNFYKGRPPKKYYSSWLTERRKYKCVTHFRMLPEPPK